MGFRSRQLRTAAERYLARRGTSVPPAGVRRLLEDAAAHLLARFPAVKPAAAAEAALAAWSDMEGRRTRCYVDLQASTPHLLFLVDPVAGARRPIPVVDLVRILGPRSAAA
ncbi:MAG: hypothetical protein ACOYXW_11180 [Actinomycetota bacterium]